jgi:CBS domain-containing protein
MFVPKGRLPMVRTLIPDVIHDQQLLMLSPDSSVRDAARAMAARDVRSVLIARDGRLLGIFTGTDLVKRVVAPGLDPDRTRLDAVMTPEPRSITPETNALDALRLMQFCKCRHLPILRDGIVVGVVSRRDFAGYEIEEIEHQERVWQVV